MQVLGCEDAGYPGHPPDIRGIRHGGAPDTYCKPPCRRDNRLRPQSSDAMKAAFRREAAIRPGVSLRGKLWCIGNLPRCTGDLSGVHRKPTALHRNPPKSCSPRNIAFFGRKQGRSTWMDAPFKAPGPAQLHQKPTGVHRKPTGVHRKPTLRPVPCDLHPRPKSANTLHSDGLREPGALPGAPQTYWAAPDSHLAASETYPGALDTDREVLEQTSGRTRIRPRLPNRALLAFAAPGVACSARRGGVSKLPWRSRCTGYLPSCTRYRPACTGNQPGCTGNPPAIAWRALHRACVRNRG